MNLKDNKVFVQIGTNNGDDDFNKLVKLHSPSKIILVEPNISLNEKIHNSYENVENVFLENVIISNYKDEKIKLVKPKNNINGKSINGIKYDDGHYSLLPLNDWGNVFDYIETDTLSFMSLCEKYNLTDIHFLQIDTEGYDSEIILSINFNKVNIDIIKYEKWYFDESFYEKYGALSKKYGANGMNEAKKYLISNDYTFIDNEKDLDHVVIKK
jgi:hypothetical protein